MRLLLFGHRAADPPEATLVLAAAAAANGLRRDGEPLPEGSPRAPSLRDLADELGLHVGAVRRGVRHLVTIGAATFDRGVWVAPAALRERWADPRRRCRLEEHPRRLGLRAAPLLLVGLVAGLVDTRGQLCLGRAYLAERLGLPFRTVDRALASAAAAGAIQRWVAPIAGGRLCLAVPVSQNGERAAARTGEREERPNAPPSRNGEPPVAKRRTPRRETANPIRTTRTTRTTTRMVVVVLALRYQSSSSTCSR